MTTLDLNAKTIMSHLLLGSAFHRFALIEGEVTTFNKFSIDGRLRQDFFDEKKEQDYSRWKDVQEYFLSVIRGKRTPLDFKIVLSLAEEDFSTFLAGRGLPFHAADIQGLYLNLRYDGSKLQCVTGTSMNIFTLDKSLEHEWDEYAKNFFLELENKNVCRS